MVQDNHIMIDLETLGLKQDAAIISIGAAKFDIEKGVITSVMHRNILWADALKYGKSEPSTVDWWSNQSPEAKAALEKPKQVKFVDALDDFVEWMEEDPIVWGNGALFDLAKLEHKFESLDRPHPWFYRNTRDVRTIVQIGGLVNFLPGDQPFVGTKHDPVDDAVNTALYVCEVLNRVKMATLSGCD